MEFWLLSSSATYLWTVHIPCDLCHSSYFVGHTDHYTEEIVHASKVPRANDFIRIADRGYPWQPILIMGKSIVNKMSRNLTVPMSWWRSLARPPGATWFRPSFSVSGPSPSRGSASLLEIPRDAH